MEAASETPSPKARLNLAGLKAAFSSHHSSNVGHKSKAAASGPMQKTLQSFYKGNAKPTDCIMSLKSPSKTTFHPAKCSPVGKSVLDGFRYRTSCSDTDSDKESTKPSCDVTVEVPDIQFSSKEFRSPEKITDTSVVKEETLTIDDSCPTGPEDAELQTESGPFKEECIGSPDAKRARTEEPLSPTKDKSSSISNYSEKAAERVDAPVCVQRRAVPLLFSFTELTGRMKRLQDQQAQRTSDVLCYRRFKAKINPGENQSAEEELRKEIR